MLTHCRRKLIERRETTPETFQQAPWFTHYHLYSRKVPTSGLFLEYLQEAKRLLTSLQPLNVAGSCKLLEHACRHRSCPPGAAGFSPTSCRPLLQVAHDVETHRLVRAKSGPAQAGNSYSPTTFDQP
ncbi:hypothetical protein BT63DRAFT_454670 [Microthyrium microscopicum]|uniref:Uncharacterized protein n=1 Tax=Microthyrium microscopicum TaxID=703497 RepID=A0A6A6UFZ0_9PEZI|nr:hypothetical protein BT63DRAFT_454670 [Microthyrium microscopicum]